MMKSILRAVCPLALLALAACSTAPTKSGGGDKSVLMDRALERWGLLINSNPSAAWELLSPGYRETHPRNTYAEEMSRRPVRWSKVESFSPQPESPVGPVECNDTITSCEVRLTVHFKIRSHLTSVGIIETQSVVKENWIKLKGQWYFVPQDVVK